MSTALARTREDVLAPIATAFEEAAPDGGGAEFVARYFRHVPLDELTSRTPDIYAGAAASHLELARDRPAGVANVRVYNPSTEVDGWSNARTIIQIVTDDMPFLVDSVTGALVNAGIDIHLIVHPQLVVSRDAAGGLEHVVPRDVTGKTAKGAVGELAESWMLLSIDRESDEERRAVLERTVRHVLEDVRQSVEDWPKMRSKCLVLAAELEGSPPPGVDADETALAIRFLRWMAEDHFTFLGYRDYTLMATPEGEVLAPVTGSGRGLLRSDPPLGQEHVVLSPQASQKAHEPQILVLTKANSRSTVHRIAHLDYVGVKAYDERGEVVGERRFLGLYASTAYTESVQRVPLVAEKVQAVLDRSGVALDSHTGKDLLQVLESYPRDELIQASIEQLYDTAMAVTAAAGAPPHQAVHPRGRLRPLRLLPRLHPPGPLQHGRPAADGRDPQGDLRRRVGRVQRAGQRVGALPAAVRRPGAEGPAGADARPGRAGLRRAAPRRGQPYLVRSPRRRPALDVRRGGRRPPHGPVRAGVPHGLRGDVHGQPGPGRPGAPRPARGRPGHQCRALPPGRRPAEHPPVQAVPGRAALAHRHPADLHPHGRRGRRRAALRGGPRGRHHPARLRLRPARARPRDLGGVPARQAA